MSERATKQEDVEDLIVEILEDGHVKITGEITKIVKARLPLVAADLKRAANRGNESKVDQIIANALQAKRRICRDGLIERVGKGEFRITAIGKECLRRNREVFATLSALVGEISDEAL